MGHVQIKNLMAEMKLNGMLGSLEKTLDDAKTQSWSYTELLDSLIQAEYDFKEQRKIENLLKASKLPEKPVFEDFDFTTKRTLTKTQVKELYQLTWLSQHRPVLLIGPTGIGKSFIAKALAHHACHHKYSVLYMTDTIFIELLTQARAINGYLKFKDKLVRPDILIIDNFGSRKLHSQEAQDLCDILEDRLRNKSTIFTTQLPVDNWNEVITDPVIADSIIDRLTHSALKIKIEGDTYRKRVGEKFDKDRVVMQ